MSKTTGEDREAGRFQPGCSGNPAGRPKGARNKATLLAEERLEEHLGSVLETQLERALAGSVASARFCLRHAGLERKDCYRFDIPNDLETSADVIDAQRALIFAVADGQVPPREAERLMKYLDSLGEKLRHEAAKAGRGGRQDVEAAGKVSAAIAEVEAVQVEMECRLEADPANAAAKSLENAAHPAEGDVENNREIQVEPGPPAPSPLGSAMMSRDADRVIVGRDFQSGSAGRTSTCPGVGSTPSAASLSA